MRVACFLAVLTTALSVSAAEPSFHVHLIEPAAGTDLAAGSTAFIAWETSEKPANVDEWEAFISVDAGRTYPLRVTPHLDAAIHRFRWSVPSLPGAEVTLLLRFGDESEERRFVFPTRMRISGIASSPSLWPGPQIEAVERGKDLDLGEEGASAWVEGSRDGSSLRQVALAGTSMSGHAEFDMRRDGEPAGSLLAGGGRDDSIGRPIVEQHTAPDRGRRSPARACLGRFVADILLISRRRNI